MSPTATTGRANPVLRIAMLALLGVLASGCQTTSNYRNSSVVDYLYPGSKRAAVEAEVPRLALPLKVGVAFTPGHYRHADHLTENKKMALMESVGEHFRSLEFVDKIEVIPSGYLRPEGSFSNLEQLQRMFNVDVIALISYDQTTFVDESIASIAYWTIVGAYIIPGEKNSTHTMLDAVVYDIASRKMLFRAPGVSTVKSRATLVGLQEQTREDSFAGFEQASEDLVTNLKSELDRFQDAIKRAPDEVQIVNRDGSAGGGFGMLLLVLLAVPGLRRARRMTREETR